MFIGHFAAGFAARPLTPRVPLAVLFAAAQLADLMWPVLLAGGLEHVRIDPGNTAVTPFDFVSYPYSHSLATLIVWGILAGIVVSRVYRDRRALVLVSGLVVSHWVLDFITHRPDMPLYPFGDRYGLGLWNSMPGTVGLEFAMYGVGVWLYARATRPRDAIGRWAFIAFAAFLVVVYVGNLMSPPPPSVRAVWIAGVIGSAILLAWTAWFDRHRDLR